MGIIFLHVEQTTGLFTVPLSWPIIFSLLSVSSKLNMVSKLWVSNIQNPIPLVKNLIGLELMDNGKIMGTVKSPKG